MLKSYLFIGHAVSYLSSFMDPFTQSGDELLFDPIYDRNLIQQGDVVFCEPSDKYILVNKVLWIASGSSYFTNAGRLSSKWFAIGNPNGTVEAWAKECHLYGRLVEIKSAR